ncbi:hypothetical protein JRI60_21225 [Archangium violaceum]|uniref:hypothetical protein n=1 Tax=Archangium violaceum TaxID=83451 RepID=UPI00194F4865|nr:hypothetical protein [Archangium violaceum]QRO01362.1 hypothetical protein JRI60_21225 [Archangium violaceum]
MPRWTGTWRGGRTYQKRNGQTVYVLRKTVDGMAYQHVLDVRTEELAEAELALFFRDPASYRPRRMQHDVRLGVDSIARYVGHLRTSGHSESYIQDSRRYLNAWATSLKGANLAKLDPSGVKATLNRWLTARKTRIIVFKAFCSWLRVQGLLPEENDPSRALRVPASRPECVHRTIAITDSGASRSPIPEQADHRFRSKPIGDTDVGMTDAVQGVIPGVMGAEKTLDVTWKQAASLARRRTWPHRGCP